jgi:hypothetical protein
MTSFTLSTVTQNAITYALANGPGTNNANYLEAYTDIYNDLVAQGGINSSVLYWFSQAGGINSQQYTQRPREPISGTTQKALLRVKELHLRTLNFRPRQMP